MRDLIGPCSVDAPLGPNVPTIWCDLAQGHTGDHVSKCTGMRWRIPAADPDALRSTTDHAIALTEARTRVVEAAKEWRLSLAAAVADEPDGAARHTYAFDALKAAVDALEEVERHG